MSVPNRYLNYSRQSVGEDDIRAVEEVLRSDFLTQGPKVGEFEAALADYCGAKYAAAVCNGTAALHAAYFAAGIGPGDEIVTSPITFAATANAALYLGARPVFADVDQDTGNVDPAKMEAAITERTRALVPVHYAGRPCDLDAVHEIARRRGLLVIEDACHALGAEYKGRKIGALSDMSVFSFHPVKPITTGEGGAVLTNDPEFKRRLELFRSHGITRDPDGMDNESEGPWFYEMRALGFNYRITDMQCALGISQLKKLDSFIERRRLIVEKYRRAFAEDPRVQIPKETEGVRSSWHLLAASLTGGAKKRRREIFEELRRRKIGAQVHYIPVYRHPYYRKNGYADVTLPGADAFYEKELSLPVFQGMTGAELEYVIENLKDLLEI